MLIIRFTKDYKENVKGDEEYVSRNDAFKYVDLKVAEIVNSRNVKERFTKELVADKRVGDKTKKTLYKTK